MSFEVVDISEPVEEITAVFNNIIKFMSCNELFRCHHRLFMVYIEG